MIISLKELAIKCGYKYIGNDVSINKISISSNDIGEDTLFVAIIANRDGHNFIESAIKNNAKALLVSKEQKNINIPQIVCDNTKLALRELAKEKRKIIKGKIFAVTGTCGKTSVKEMIVSLLNGYKVHYTKGNLNNYLGVPITILETPLEAEYLIIETGTSVFGEIKASADIIKPDVSLINNIGASHLENLKTLDGVMQEKGALFDIVDKNGFCIVNLDDSKIIEYAKKITTNKISYSIKNAKADINILMYRQLSNKFEISLNIFDKNYNIVVPLNTLHSLKNLLASVASILALGINIDFIINNLSKIKAYNGRFADVKISNNITLIDDTYNASAPSMQSAIEDLSRFKGKKILIASAMKELGDLDNHYHQEMGKWILKANLDNIFLYGNEKSLLEVVNKSGLSIKNIYFSKENIIKDLMSILKNNTENTKIIVKGARSSRMEQIVKEFQKVYSS